MPRRLHCCFARSMRGREEGLVSLNAGATAGVVGFLQGVQKHPDLGCKCQRSIAREPVVSSTIAGRDERAQRYTSLLKPHTGRAGSLFEVGSSDRGSAECRHRALEMVGVCATGDICVSRWPSICGLAQRSETPCSEHQFELEGRRYFAGLTAAAVVGDGFQPAHQ